MFWVLKKTYHFDGSFDYVKHVKVENLEENVPSRI